MISIYLDVCVLCRPFDDQSVVRTRIETDAVYLIEEHVRLGRYSLLVSPAHLAEIAATTRHEEAAELLAFLHAHGSRHRWDLRKARARAEALYARRFGAADSVHVAFAEQAASVFLTCDDRLLAKCRRLPVLVPAMGPVEFCVKEGLR